MANSCSRKPAGFNPFEIACRTPGALGYNDAGSPDSPLWFLGDTPGALGYNDHADPEINCNINQLLNVPSTDAGIRQPPAKLSLSAQGRALLKQIESLRLKPYDDQTRKEISAWTEGATIGYGHLIRKSDWAIYKESITESDAATLFDKDLSPFETAVRTNITVNLAQKEFDALVVFAFNIGPGKDGFAGSSVVKIINDPGAKTSYNNLEAAWKAWNKSQKKVNKGLINRRQCEWQIYTEGIYMKW